MTSARMRTWNYASEQGLVVEQASDPSQQVLVLSTGDDDDEDGLDLAPQLKMLHETSGRASQPKSAVCIWLDGPELQLLGDFLKGIQDMLLRAESRRNPEHYIERMLDFTSGRASRSSSASSTMSFMLHISSGRRISEEFEEEGQTTTDMMRFTSGRREKPLARASREENE
jgi:hypothetical protein